MMSSFCLILFIFLFIVLLSTDRRKNDNERGGNGDIGDSGGGVIHVVVTALSLTTSTCTTCSSRNSISTTCSRRISSTSFTFSKGSESFPFRSSATTNSIYATDPKQGEKIFEKMLTSTSSSSEEEEEEEEAAERGIIGPFTLLLTSQFLLFIGVGAVIPSIPLYGKEIGLSGAANGIIISAPAVALFLAANWSGRRADLARKPAMMIGMAIIAISDVGTALAQALPSLIVARLGLGAGRALSEAGERGMLLDFSNQMKKMRGRALALQQIVVALGIGIGAPLGGIVVERYGPRAAFYCVSVAAVIALILYAFLPETIVRVKGGGVPPVVVIQKDDTEKRSSKTTASSLSRSSTATATATTSISISTKEEEGILLLNENTSGIQVWNELLKDNQWRGLVLCQSGASWGYAAKIASIPILAADTLPGGAAGAGLLISAAALSGLIGAPIGGVLIDRIGSKGTAVIGGVVSSVGLICIPLALQLTADTTQAINLSITTIHDNYLVLPMEIVVGGVLLQSKALFFSLAVLLWSMGVSAQGPALTALAQENCRPGVEATSLSLAKASIDGTYIIAPFILGLVTDALMEVPGIECAFAGSLVFVGTLALAILVQNTDDLECPV